MKKEIINENLNHIENNAPEKDLILTDIEEEHQTKDKHKHSKVDVLSFISNFVAIVLGIVITFIGQNYIESDSTKKQVNNALFQIKNELKQNKQVIERIRDVENFEQKAFQYVYKHKSDIATADSDTLLSLGRFMYTASSSSSTVDAFEMLKLSGLTTQIEDKDLLVKIIKTYKDISIAMDMFNGYMLKKQELMDGMMNNQIFQANLMGATSLSINEQYALILSMPEGVKYIPTMGFYHNDPFKTYNILLGQIDSLINQIE